MDKTNAPEHPERPSPPFPWETVLLWVLLGAAAVALVVLLFKLLRRTGPAPLMAAAGSAMALSGLTARKPASHPKRPIDMAFLNTVLRAAASRNLVLTPTELRFVFNRLFTTNHLPPPFASEQHMAKVLGTLGLRSDIRTVPGQSARRWYDLARFGKPEESGSPDERPSASP